MAIINIALVEDDEEIRNSILLFLSRSDDIHVAGGYGCAEDFTEDFSTLDVDVVLMDITLPGMSGIDCVSVMKPQRPQVQYLMCTVHEDHDRIFASLCAGATGYITKNSPPSKLMEAIREIYNGGSPMSAQIARMVVDNFRNKRPSNGLLDTFTQREQEILQALAKGFQYKEIADKLLISIDTVRSYLRKIYEKLQVHSKIEALNKVFPKDL